MSATVVVTISAGFFLLIFLSGIWLSRTGRPLHAGLSTAHKLVSLAAGIFLLVIMYQHNRMAPLNTFEWTAIVVTGLCFLGTVASGGFLSTDKPAPVALLRVHQVVPVLTLISSAVTLYLLQGAA